MKLQQKSILQSNNSIIDDSDDGNSGNDGINNGTNNGVGSASIYKNSSSFMQQQRETKKTKGKGMFIEYIHM